MKNFSLAFFPAKANTSQFTDLLSVVTGRHLDDRDGDDLRSFRQRLAVAGILFQIEQEIRPGRSQFSGYRDTFSPQVETRGNLLRMAQFRE